VIWKVRFQWVFVHETDIFFSTDKKNSRQVPCRGKQKRQRYLNLTVGLSSYQVNTDVVWIIISKVLNGPESKHAGVRIQSQATKNETHNL